MTATISDRAKAFMMAWHSWAPTVAVMGEYSSGKSALLNSLLGRQLLPTRVTATDLPAVWIVHGKGGTVQGLGFDGHLVTLSPEDLTNGRATQFLCMRIEAEADILQRFAIIDTPGISDPRMTTDIVSEMSRHVDFAIWCSPLNQAWRQTERAFWKSLPIRSKPASILALTRADMMGSARDVEKVLRRCVAETAGSFAAVLPVAAPLAVAARAATSEAERDNLLRGSGLPALLEQISQSVARIEAAGADRPKLQEPPTITPLALTPEMIDRSGGEAPRKTKVASKAASKPAPKATPAKRAAGKAGAPISNLRERVKKTPPNDQGLDTIRLLFNELDADKVLAAEHRDVLVRALFVPAVGGLRPERLLKQVEQELEDFADGPWCELTL